MTDVRSRLAATFTRWPFLLGLLVLLANDFWLKRSFPGMLTGKLSDFAGVALVALLLLAIAPRRRGAVFTVVAVGFAFWKSPWSQPLIDSANLYLPWRFGRVTDYTDLAALLVLPLCKSPAVMAAERRGNTSWVRRLLVAPVAAATLLGLMATSMVRAPWEFHARQRNPAAELNHAVVAAAVAEVAKDRNMECVDCTDTSSEARYRKGLVSLSYSFPDSHTVEFTIEAYSHGLLAPNPSPEKAQRLVDALKKKLSRTYGDLEFSNRVASRHR